MTGPSHAFRCGWDYRRAFSWGDSRADIPYASLSPIYFSSLKVIYLAYDFAFWCFLERPTVLGLDVVFLSFTPLPLWSLQLKRRSSHPVDGIC